MIQLSPMTTVLLECVRFERQPVQTPEALEALEAIRAALATIFGTIARILAASPSRKGWKADPERPGYLIQSVGDLEIRAPWNLLADFPPTEILTELGAFAQRIRSGPETAICLSGSSTFYSTIQAIGDLDFCEYVELPSPGRRSTEDRSFARTIRKSVQLDDDDLTCFGLKVLQTGPSVPWSRSVTRQRPWTSSPADDETFLRLARGTTCGKCDFVARTRFEGTLEMTNLVLFLRSDRPEEGAGELSFTPQEAPMTGEGGWVPRRLDEPRTLGRYIDWLWRELLDHLSQEHIDFGKAMKRALALTRILFLETQGEKLLSLLGDRKLMLGAAIRARLGLRSKLRALEDEPALRRFEEPLRQAIAGLVERFDDPELPLPLEGATVEAMDLWCRRTEEILDSTVHRYLEASQRLRSLVAELSGLL
jgi:hypothetical protein